jgi:hypothetical protein
MEFEQEVAFDAVPSAVVEVQLATKHRPEDAREGLGGAFGM